MSTSTLIINSQTEMATYQSQVCEVCSQFLVVEEELSAVWVMQTDQVGGGGRGMKQADSTMNVCMECLFYTRVKLPWKVAFIIQIP